MITSHFRNAKRRRSNVGAKRNSIVAKRARCTRAPFISLQVGAHPDPSAAVDISQARRGDGVRTTVCGDATETDPVVSQPQPGFQPADDGDASPSVAVSEIKGFLAARVVVGRAHGKPVKMTRGQVLDFVPLVFRVAQGTGTIRWMLVRGTRTRARARARVCVCVCLPGRGCVEAHEVSPSTVVVRTHAQAEAQCSGVVAATIRRAYVSTVCAGDKLVRASRHAHQPARTLPGWDADEETRFHTVLHATPLCPFRWRCMALAFPHRPLDALVRRFNSLFVNTVRSWCVRVGCGACRGCACYASSVLTPLSLQVPVGSWR